MKIIIDKRLLDRIESIRLRPNRLFHCSGCNCNYQRNQVSKDHQGNYSCLHCGKPVVDITNTDDGQQLTSILGIG